MTCICLQPRAGHVVSMCCLLTPDASLRTAFTCRCTACSGGLPHPVSNRKSERDSMFVLRLILHSPSGFVTVNGSTTQDMGSHQAFPALHGL